MRDIQKYEYSYMEESFEKYQVEYRRKKVIERINKYKSQNILEIGCGLKPLFIDELCKNINFTVVEPGKEFYSNAEKLNNNKKNRIINDFFDESFGEKYGCERFDLIVCSGLLHEVENPVSLINAIKKVSANDTIIHINVPNANSIHRIIAKEMGLISDVYAISERNVQLQQHSVFDIDLLKKMVMEYGLNIINEGSYFIKPFSHKQMMDLLDKEIIEENVLDALYSLEKYIPGFGSEIYVEGMFR